MLMKINMKENDLKIKNTGKELNMLMAKKA